MDGAAKPLRLRLPRSSRLKRKSDFDRTRAQGRRLVSGCLVVNLRPRTEGGWSRLGVVAGRNIGNAPVRSRARRLLRESFRLHQRQFGQPLDVVLVARASIAGKKLAQVEEDFLRALKQARVMAGPLRESQAH